MYKISKRNLGLAKVHAGVESDKNLAALSGVSVNTISRINNGGRAKLATVQALAVALGVDIAELLEEV